MHRMLSLAVVVVAVVGCSKKDKDAPAPAPSAKESGSAAPTAETGSAEATPPTPSPTPAPPPPAPVAMTADQLKPTCDKLFPPDIATKAFGADKVESKTPESAGGKPLAICEFSKGGEVVGSANIACNPDLDVSLIANERAAMTKAKDIPAGIGRGGYRLSNAFFFNDDETPCRINANFMSPPEDEAALADVLRVILAAVNPASLQ